MPHRVREVTRASQLAPSVATSTAQPMSTGLHLAAVPSSTGPKLDEHRNKRMKRSLPTVAAQVLAKRDEYLPVTPSVKGATGSLRLGSSMGHS